VASRDRLKSAAILFVGTVALEQAKQALLLGNTDRAARRTAVRSRNRTYCDAVFTRSLPACRERKLDSIPSGDFASRTCESRELPENLLRFWIGHGDKTVTDRYAKLSEDVAFRKAQATRVGLVSASKLSPVVPKFSKMRIMRKLW
jgi:hypothetical protein